MEYHHFRHFMTIANRSCLTKSDASADVLARLITWEYFIIVTLYAARDESTAAYRNINTHRSRRYILTGTMIPWPSRGRNGSRVPQAGKEFAMRACCVLELAIIYHTLKAAKIYTSAPRALGRAMIMNVFMQRGFLALVRPASLSA
jgi:hypothetical protein